MSYPASAIYHGEFTTCSSTGAAADADSLPTATANKNGTDDGGFTLTCAKLDTGRYKITGTIPSTYKAQDRVNVSVAATIGGVATKAIVESFSIAPTPFIADNVLAASTPTTGGFIGTAALVATDDYYKNLAVCFTSGVLAGLTNKVTGYTGSTQTFAFSTVWPAAPSALDTFIIIGRLG